MVDKLWYPPGAEGPFRIVDNGDGSFSLGVGGQTWAPKNSKQNTRNFTGVITLLPTPAAPTLGASTTGGSLTTGTYYVKIQQYCPTSTSLASVEQSVVVTGPTGSITVTLPALPANATGSYIFVSNASGQEVYSGSTTGSSYTIAALPGGGAVAPASVVVVPLYNVPVGKTFYLRDVGLGTNTTTSQQCSVNASQTPNQLPFWNGFVSVYGQTPGMNAGVPEQAPGNSQVSFQINQAGVAAILTYNIGGLDQ